MLNGSEGEEETGVKHVIHLYTDHEIKLNSHPNTRTLVTQCRKTFTGNALEDIFISIYFI